MKGAAINLTVEVDGSETEVAENLVDVLEMYL